MFLFLLFLCVVILSAFIIIFLPRLLSSSSVPGPAPAATGQFCGGFAGLSCSEGYTCKLEGSYPDAGGVCVRK